MSAQKTLEQAKAIALLDRDEMSPDLVSHLATFDAKVEQGDDRAAHAWARVVVKLADREGFEGESKPTTVKGLQAEIASRNEGRDEADLIKPASQKKADLEQALADDDAS